LATDGHRSTQIKKRLTRNGKHANASPSPRSPPPVGTEKVVADRMRVVRFKTNSVQHDGIRLQQAGKKI